MTGLRLWSGGVPLDDLGPVGDDLLIATVFGDGGCGVDQVSWSMGLPRGFTHPALKQGAVVELRRGPLVVATVINDEPDVDAWKLSAKGLIHRAADFIAVNSAGTPTNMLADAVNAAVANGLEWKVPTDLANAIVSIDSVDQVLTVADLLNRYCAQTSQRWGITGSGWLRFYTDPTSPRWVLTPDAPSLASARGQVSRLRVRYATSFDDSGSPATLATVIVPPIAAGQKGVVESFVDITGEQGGSPLNAVQATTVGYEKLSQQAPQQSFTSGITPGPGQLTNIGDVPMDGGLWLVALDVAEGAMVRSQGWRNPDVGVSGMGFDWIAGGATWSKPSGITITPLAMSASTFSDNMAEIRAGVQAAQSAANTALAVGSPDYLQSLITATSVTTLGTLPASASIGDLCVVGGKAYVCTLAYSSGGTLTANWVQATDPRTIALISATATAVFAADNANSAAATAQASADGKNTIHYNALAPTSSYPGVIGDTVFVFSGSFVTAQYKLTAVSGGTYTWSPVQLASAVIANLDAGKITTGVLSAINISGVNISGSTITGGSFSTAGANPITMAPYGSSFGADVLNIGGGGQLSSNGSNVYFETSGSMLSFTGPSLFYIGQDQGLQVDHAANFYSAAHFYSTVTADGDINANGGRFVAASLPTTTIAPNCLVSLPSGVFFTTSGSSRAVKYDIEPAEIDDDIDALEKCGVFAYHYRTDPEARLMIGLVVEDMLEQGLRRYVDFDENDEPLQPSWNQISALLIAAHQRNARRLSSLEARLTALEAS